jgi:F0F1-type ATP synthase membrane subunit b/b'
VALRERAAGELVAARRQAESDLAGELSRLALGAAEQVVHSNLDDATHQDLIEAYIRQVGRTDQLRPEKRTTR